MDEVKWVYDEVINLEGEIVALMYHLDKGNGDSPDCLQHDQEVLNREGLSLHVSKSFNTLSEAQQHAWTKRDLFSKDLD